MIPDPGTDPVEEGGAQYGFLARIVGLPLLERRLLEAIERMTTATAADVAALEAARDTLAAADQTIDQIEKGTNP